MKTTYNMPVLPASGVKVTLEGTLTRLLFDFEKDHPYVPEGMPDPENEYRCESVDCIGRTRDDIISAIVNDRYPLDKYQAVESNHNLATDESSDLTPEKRAEYISEYDAFQAWRKHAKEIAAIAVSLIESATV